MHIEAKHVLNLNRRLKQKQLLQATDFSPKFIRVILHGMSLPTYLFRNNTDFPTLNTMFCEGTNCVPGSIPSPNNDIPEAHFQ